MSLFSTITHPETSGLNRVSPRGVGAFALILAAGMALGYAISVIDLTAETDGAAVESLTHAEYLRSHAEFLRLNTTDLEWMEPMIPDVAVAQTQPVEVDPFTWANVGSYTALNQPWQVAAEFTRVNTSLPVYGPYDKAEAARFDRFVAINTTDYQALNQAWHVDPRFLELNTNLGTTYTEPASGPR